MLYVGPCITMIRAHKCSCGFMFVCMCSYEREYSIISSEMLDYSSARMQMDLMKYCIWNPPLSRMPVRKISECFVCDLLRLLHSNSPCACTNLRLCGRAPKRGSGGRVEA